jgi:hypothetical protein
MDFDNKLKGNLTEIISSSIFEDAGYRVVPLGVEKIVREITTLAHEEYKALNLSKTLRSMPDLLVTDVDMSKAWLVEVKYRKTFVSFKSCSKLQSTLNEQAKRWGAFYVLLYVGEQASKMSLYSGSFCGVIKLDSKNDVLHFESKSSGKLVGFRNLNWDDFSRVHCRRFSCWYSWITHSSMSSAYLTYSVVAPIFSLCSRINYLRSCLPNAVGAYATAVA